MATYTDPSLNITHDVTVDAQSSSIIFTGEIYAFQATGGFTVEQGFQNIHRLPEQQIQIFDTTGAVEFAIDAQVLNSYLGIYKAWNATDKAWDLTGTETFYDNSNNILIQNGVHMDAQDFKKAVFNVSNVVDVGKFSTIYVDFANYVATYFGLVAPSQKGNVGAVYDASGVATGFATLFNGDYAFDPSNGIFDTPELFRLINKGNGVFDATTNAGIIDIQGFIDISNVTQLLRNAVDANPFGNRDPNNGSTAVDSNDRANYGVTDGFMPDDLIFIPENGFSITLNVNIDYSTTINNYVSNNIGAGLSAVNQSNLDASYNQNQTQQGSSAVASKFHATTVTTTSLLSRTITAPLLLRLIDRQSPDATDRSNQWASTKFWYQ